ATAHDSGSPASSATQVLALQRPDVASGRIPGRRRWRPQQALRDTIAIAGAPALARHVSARRIAMNDSFSTHDNLEVNGKTYRYASLAKLGKQFDLRRLPYSMKILLENLLRHEDGVDVTRKEISAVANWQATVESDTEISFMPARVVLQDFTGVPCVVDLAAMRDAMVALGGDPTLINPLAPAELVIDHSVQVDSFGSV